MAWSLLTPRPRSLRLLLDQGFPNPPGFTAGAIDHTVGAVSLYEFDSSVAENSTPDWVLYCLAAQAGFEALVTRDRAIVHSLLRSKGVTHNVTVPVSAGLLTHVESYFDALTEYRRGRPGPIVRLMAEASFSSIANGRELVVDLRRVRERWNERIHARSDAAAWKVADMLVVQPVVDSPTVQKHLHAPAMSANRAIERLVRDRVLKELTGRRRNRLYEAREVLVALDGFATRAGRRPRGTAAPAE